jgi:two-component system, chemotaxis family, protein-glutamate methylesterase/glutaminase
MAPPTRVLIVDDSATARASLAHAIAGAQGIELAGVAARGSDALALIERLKPDIATIDVYLGEEDGVALTNQITARRALPILIVTGIDPRNAELAFRAMRAGALDVLPKPPAPTHPDYPPERQRLLRTLSALARVPMVTRHPRVHARGAMATPSLSPEKAQIVAIGASTGGPPVLADILTKLPSPFPVPIVVVQHLTAGFADTFAAWLASTTGHRVRVCNGTTALEPGTMYIAPGRAHMRLTSAFTLGLSDAPAQHFQKPSIDVLFESVAAWCGRAAVGVLLTGMGSDGAAGLGCLDAAGAFTVVQSASTCAVDSMPASAIQLGAARVELTPAEIARLLPRLVS